MEHEAAQLVADFPRRPVWRDLRRRAKARDQSPRRAGEEREDEREDQRGVQGEIQQAGGYSVREGHVKEEIEGYDDGVGGCVGGIHKWAERKDIICLEESFHVLV